MKEKKKTEKEEKDIDIIGNRARSLMMLHKKTNQAKDFTLKS